MHLDTIMRAKNFNLSIRFQLWCTLLLILLISSVPQINNAQDINHQHFSNWNTFNLSKSLQGKFYLNAEFNIRRTNFLKDWEQFIFRPSVHLKPYDWMDLSVGYSYIKNYSYASFSIPIDAVENNIWQQLSIHHSMVGLSFEHRVRLEERFIERISLLNGEYAISGTIYSNRLRYRLTLSKLLKTFRNKQELSVIANDELFINLTDADRFGLINQNWMYIGLNYKFNEKFSLRSGYRYIYQRIRSGEYISNNVWETVFSYHLK